MTVGQKEFVEQVRQEFEKRTGKEVVTGEMNRVKGEISYLGLLVLGKEENDWPLLYTDQLYGNYRNGKDLESIVTELLVRNEKRTEGTEWTSYLDSFERAKPYLCYQLIHRETNLAALSDCPQEPFLDLVKAYGVLTKERKGWQVFLNLRNTQLERWGISEQELKEQAEANMKSLLPVKKKTFRALFQGTKEQETKWDAFLKSVQGETAADTMLILTNSIQFYGASVIAYEGVLEEIAEEWGGHLLISPSNVHEVVVRPLKDGMGLSACVEALRMGNASRRRKEEILSNHVYLYEKGTGHIVVI